MPGYAICTVPRSGSTFLCYLLRATGVLGRPWEYFNTDANRAAGIADYPFEPEAQLNALTRLAATPNGVYGFKLFPNQFDTVAATNWAVRLPALSFVYLERRDILGQAISYVRALQTRQWVAGGQPAQPAAYDGGWIDDELTRLARWEARWRFWFGRNGIEPLRLVYEELMADPQAAVDAIAALMGIASPPRVDPAPLADQIQRDTLNEAWRRRYLAEHRNLTRFL